MSYLYTLQNVDREKKFNKLFDIINPVIKWDDSLTYYPYMVLKEEEMRPDMICFNIYNHFNYIDEILTWNNIINPWSIKEGQIIYYLEEDSVISLQLQKKKNSDEIVNELVNSNKDTKKDPNRESGTGLPPTIKPAGLKDVTVDFNNKTIKIMDKFK